MIYVIRAKTGLYKIGYSASEEGVAMRRNNLQTGNPHKLEVIVITEGERTHEKQLHKLLARFKQKGEWFSDTEWADRLLHNVIGLLESYSAEFVLSQSEEQLYRVSLLNLPDKTAVWSLNFKGMATRNERDPIYYRGLKYRDCRI